MAQRRKLQVFVSSTFTDLKEERQAAVEAILTAGHIPAGMELFAAGDESQMAVIRRWIDESDVYLLLLGGRYGSIESLSGKSYTQLEYEYALEKGKALFAVVITEKQLDEKNQKEGKQVLELENPQKLKDFRNLVTSKLVKFWNDNRDIKLAILQTLSEFDRREDLVGWIPGNEATNSGVIAEELATLSRENTELRSRLESIPKETTSFNGLNYEEVINYLIREVLNEKEFKGNYYEVLTEITAEFSSYQAVSLLSFFFLWGAYKSDLNFITIESDEYSVYIAESLIDIGLVQERQKATTFSPSPKGTGFYYMTQSGLNFLLRLRVIYNSDIMKQIIEKFKRDNPKFEPF